MFSKNIRASLRNLRRNKLYSILNIAGLAAGFAGAMLIGLFVADEWRFDGQHANADRIFRVIEENTSAEGKTTQTASTSLLIAERSKQELAEIADVVKMGLMYRADIWTDDPATRTHYPFWHADASFGKIFDFKWLAGDRITALDAPFTVIVTQSFARKLFGTDQCLGQVIHNEKMPGSAFTVTGVIEDFPKNSSIDFPFAVSTRTFEGNADYKDLLQNDWTSNRFPTWFLLQKDADQVFVTQKLNAFIAANTPQNAGQPIKRSHSLLPIRDIHFKGAGITGLSNRLANPVYVNMLAAIALFLLGIACINYINLTTARAAGRSKEIGVRKVIGAGQGQIIGQFMTETYLVVTGAFLLALGLLQVILPGFNQFVEKNLTLDFSTDPLIWSSMIGMALLVGLLAGLYPSFYLAGLRPVVLFRNNLSGSHREFSLRKSLVVAQFGLSVLLIIAVGIVWKQMQFLETKDLGFDVEQLVVVDINSYKVRRDFETIKAGYAQIPGIRAVSVSSRVPGEWKTIPQVSIHREEKGENEKQEAWLIGADADFVKTFGVSLISGRNFTPGSAADTSAVLLNETAARMLGISEPSGQWIVIPTSTFLGHENQLDQPFRARVTGIVKDFHFRSLRENIAPLIIAHQSNPILFIDYFTVRLQTSETQNALAQLETVLHKTDPNHLFEWHFLNDQWALFYADDHRREKILTASAGVAIFIACLGLFGLATFAAERRRKEIGIRKVLGASISGIMGLLAKDFLTLVVAAIVIASPIAYFLMQKWLSDFAYRIEMQWWMFVGAGVVAIAVAFLTVGFQSVRAALMNPVKSLRSE